MFKKALFLILSSCISITTINSMQIATVQTAQKGALKEYQTNILRLKKLEKSHPALFAKVEPILAKIIKSDAFQTKVSSLVTDQYNTIVEQNGSFSPLQQDFYLSDYVPNATTMDKYMTNLFVLMARKEYYKKLWQQLSKKAKELATAFESVEKELGLQISEST